MKRFYPRNPFPAGYLRSDEQGAVAIIFAFTVLLLLIGAGVAIDTARLHAAYGRAQNALDSALLSAASSVNETPDVPGETLRIFNVNFPPGYLGSRMSGQGLTVSTAAGTDSTTVYTGQVSIAVPVTLMRLFGFNETNLAVRSVVKRGFTIQEEVRLELALALDTTTSMADPIAGGGTKMDALKLAAHDLMDIIYENNTILNNVYISVIPYNVVVNAGATLTNALLHPAYFYCNFWFYLCNYYVPNPSSGFEIAGWGGIANIYGRFNATAVLPDPTFFSRDFFNNSLYGHLANRDFDLPRTNNPYELTDQPPSGDPETKFRPNRGYMVNFDSANLPTTNPPNPHGSNFFDYWYAAPEFRTVVFDPISGTMVWAPRPPALFNPNLPVSAWYDVSATTQPGSSPPSGYFPVQPVPQMLFATNDKTFVLNTINAMRPNGHTRINVGLMWAWYMLSPRWRGLWDTRSVPLDPGIMRQKALVLMTDGINSVYKGQLDFMGNPGIESNDDWTTEQLCNRIKGSGYNITIYTIGLGDRNAGEINEPLLLGCASKPEYYFYAPDQAALRNAFRAIGDDLLRPTVRLIE